MMFRSIGLSGMIVVSLTAPAVGQPSWSDTMAFRGAAHGEMSALLEKTIFKVDVLLLRLRVDSLAAAEIANVALPSRSRGNGGDLVTRAVLEAHDVLAEIVFLREISLSQFLNGIDEDMKKAVRADLLREDSYEEIMAELPHVFAFAESRKIQRGDRIAYRIHGDTLRTVYRDTTGAVLLDQVNFGWQRRNSVLATFLAPGSSFRESLLHSLHLRSTQSTQRGPDGPS